MTAGAVVEVEATTSTLPVVPRRVQSGLASAAGAADGQEGDAAEVDDDAAESEPESEPHAASPIVSEATATGSTTRRMFTGVTLPNGLPQTVNRIEPHRRRHEPWSPSAREMVKNRSV